MAGIFAKLLPGSSSSSPDVSSMENLCKAINDLLTEPQDSAGIKAAELTRRNKDIFEKKTADIEAFLLHCSPVVGSAAMVAAIKAMFDTSAAKSYEAGSDRAVELLKHYLDGGQLVSSHMKIVPEIVFPLVRDVGFYCLEKKKKPEIGEAIVSSALVQLLSSGENGDNNNNNQSMITSCHAALFACALETKNYDNALKFMDEYVYYVCNERCIEENNEEAQVNCAAESSSSTTKVASQGPPRSFEKEPGSAIKIIKTKLCGSSSSSSSSALPTQPPTSQYMDPLYVFKYLYYGSLILIEKKLFKRSLVLLETCVSVPTNQPHEYQIEAYKKYILVSLLLFGYCSPINDKSPAVTRVIRGGLEEYRRLQEIKFVRGKNTHGEVQKIKECFLNTFKTDQNDELLDMVYEELKKRAVISVAKMYSSIKLSDVKLLANLRSDEEVRNVIECLVKENKLNVKYDDSKNSVIWSHNIPTIDKNDLVKAHEILDYLNHQLTERLGCLRSPVLGQKQIKNNEDEGLSMNTMES